MCLINADECYVLTMGTHPVTCLPLCSVIPGGLTGERKVDPNDATGKHVMHIANELWSAAEEMAGRKFNKFVAVGYRSQVVAGVNYFIKVCKPY